MFLQVCVGWLKEWQVSPTGNMKLVYRCVDARAVPTLWVLNGLQLHAQVAGAMSSAHGYGAGTDREKLGENTPTEQPLVQQ